MAVRNLKRVRPTRVRAKARSMVREMTNSIDLTATAPMLGVALGTYLVFWSLGQFVDRRWHYASILPTSILAIETLRAFGIDLPGGANRQFRSAGRRVVKAARRVTRRAQQMIGLEREMAGAAR
jgi:hypothetical protein